MKDDLISRQAAIDAMKQIENEDIEAYGCAIPEGFNFKRAVSALNMLPSAQPETDIIDNLIDFIEAEKQREDRVLGDWVKQWILEGVIDGNCKITGNATDHRKKKMYVEFTWYSEEQDEIHD